MMCIDAFENDTKTYDRFLLHNGLDTLLVSDPECKQTVVFLEIGAGSNQDLNTCQGLAHLMEHVIFNRSKKYPNKGYFIKLVGGEGGMFNGITEDLRTNYFFSIPSKSKKLPLIIDVFSSLISCPLLLQEDIQFERNVIQKEYDQKRTHREYIEYCILKAESEIGHPFNNFSIGNNNSLKTATSAILFDFWNKYYSSNLMKLVVISPEPIITIKKQIQPFSTIPNKNSDLIQYHFPLQHHKFITFYTCDTINNLKFRWQISDIPDPVLDYIEYLFEIDDSNSLYRHLKHKNLINNLRVDYCDYFITLSLDLTDHGQFNKQEIVNIVSSYTKFISNSDHRNSYQEFRHLEEIKYHTCKITSDMSYARELINNMQSYKPKNVITGPYFLQEFDKIKSHLHFLLTFLNHNNSIITNYSRFNTIDQKRTPYTNYIYNIDSLTPENIDLTFSLPQENNYKPDNPIYQEIHTDTHNHPVRIHHSQVSLWLKTNKTLPVIKCGLIIKCPFLKSCLENHIMTILYLNIVEEKIDTAISNAKQINYDCELSYSNNNIVLQVSGLHNKFLDVWTTALDILTKCFFTYKDLEKEKDNVLNFYKKKQGSGPLICTKILRSRLHPFDLYSEECLNIIKNITYFDMVNIEKQIFKSVKLKLLVSGYLGIKEAKTIADKVITIGKKIDVNHQDEIIHNIDIINNEIIKHPSGNLNKTDTTVLFYYEYDKTLYSHPKIDSINGHLAYIHIILKQKMFEILRLKHNICYSIDGSIEMNKDSDHIKYGASFIISTESTNLQKLKILIKSIFHKTYNEMINTPENIILKRIELCLDNMTEMMIGNSDCLFSLYMNELDYETYFFDRYDEIINRIKQSSKYDILTLFYNTFIKNDKNITIIVN